MMMKNNKNLGHGYYLTNNGEVIYESDDRVNIILSSQQVAAIELLIRVHN